MKDLNNKNKNNQNTDTAEKGRREPYKFVPVDTPEVSDIPESRIGDVMKEFHRGTWWEANRGEMAQLAVEDTHAKITNYYVIHDRDWTHGRIVDFVSMDEGTGEYTVYALCLDGCVLAVPEKDLDEPQRVTFDGQTVEMISAMPKQVKDTDALADRILAEKDRVLAEYEKRRDADGKSGQH